MGGNQKVFFLFFFFYGSYLFRMLAISIPTERFLTKSQEELLSVVIRHLSFSHFCTPWRSFPVLICSIYIFMAIVSSEHFTFLPRLQQFKARTSLAARTYHFTVEDVSSMLIVSSLALPACRTLFRFLVSSQLRSKKKKIKCNIIRHLLSFPVLLFSSMFLSLSVTPLASKWFWLTWLG